MKILTTMFALMMFFGCTRGNTYDPYEIEKIQAIQQSGCSGRVPGGFTSPRN